jgi:UDP-N-acetylmuramoylalanine--D-glutamate ligase
MRARSGIRKTAGNHYLQARTASINLFADIEHRMQTVRNWNGIEFINDSKSTDIESTYYSLELIEAPITWIVGSTDMQTDYSHVSKFVKYKVVNLIVFGNHDDAAIRKEFSSLVDCCSSKKSLEDALKSVQSLAKKGSVVLFSPACSSFDNYDDYHQRGDHFSKLVN